MIEFSDRTIVESGGNYDDVKYLMDQEIKNNDWMLRSNATVFTDILVSSFVLHFYFDKRIIIYETNRPLDASIPNSDLRELGDWCKSHGWSSLTIHDRLISDMRHFEFWMRLYQGGIIYNRQLEKKDNEILRMMNASDLVEGED